MSDAAIERALERSDAVGTGAAGDALHATHDSWYGWVDRITERYGEFIRRRCAAYATDADELEDMTQDVMIAAWSLRDQVRDPERPAAWLRCIARTVAERYRSRVLREATVAAAWVRELLPGTESDEEPTRDAMTETVFAFLDKLTPRQRRVVQGRIIEGKSTADVAREEQITEGTVKATRSQALTKLRKLMLDAGGDIEVGFDGIMRLGTSAFRVGSDSGEAGASRRCDDRRADYDPRQSVRHVGIHLGGEPEMLGDGVA